MGQIKEHYAPHPMAAGSSRKCGISVAGFLCTVAGSLTITDADGTVLIDTLPVDPMNGFIRIPLISNTNAGLTVSLTTAAGTLFT